MGNGKDWDYYREDWEEFKSWPLREKILSILFVVFLAFAASIQ